LRSNPRSAISAVINETPAFVVGSTEKGKTHFAKNCSDSSPQQALPIENHQTGDTEHSRLNLISLNPENGYSEMRNNNPELHHKDERGLM